MDEAFLEKASEREESERNLSVALISRKALKDTVLLPYQYLATECEDCGDNLPEFRMQHGLVKCVICQTKVERLKRFQA